MMNFPDTLTIDVWEGERRLITILRRLKKEDVDADECLNRRCKALEIIMKITAALNMRWQGDEPLWAMVQIEMEHCLQIYREILDVSARQIQGAYHMSVRECRDVGVQVGGSSVASGGRFKEAATSMAEEVPQRSTSSNA